MERTRSQTIVNKQDNLKAGDAMSLHDGVDLYDLDEDLLAAASLKSCSSRAQPRRDALQRSRNFILSNMHL